jgi:HlyD family secretion protein
MDAGQIMVNARAPVRLTGPRAQERAWFMGCPHNVRMNPARKTPLPPARRGRLFAIAALVALALAATWFWAWRDSAAGNEGWRTATVERGDIRVVISATGSLAATSTVDIGSQVSGLVTDVLVDHNDSVTRGQVLARLDPSTYEAQITQGSAAAAGARAGLAQAEAALRNAQADYARKSDLAGSQLVAAADVDAARAARDQARAQVASARAQITQQVASTQGSRLNLERTVIRSPVDGVVLTRSVEPGMTVAASLQAPLLFQIAEDLSKMEIVLAIDEADIGQVRQRQDVSFSVDAYPERQFRGTVQQVRLSATNTNNVITYPVVVAVDNTDLVLLPGMTANAQIEVSRRDGVLRVPNAALRFRPPDDAVAVPAGDAVPRGGSAIADDLARAAAELGLDANQQAAFDAAVAEQRARAGARSAPQGAAGGNGGGPRMFGGGGGGGARPQGGGEPGGAMRQRMIERFGQQFAGFRGTLDPERQARWDAAIVQLLGARRAPLYRPRGDRRLDAVMVRVGASDGSWTEVAGAIEEGDEVVVGSARPTP